MGFGRLMLLALLVAMISHASTMRAGAALPSGVDKQAKQMGMDAERTNAMMATGPVTGQRVKTAQFPGDFDDDADDDRDRFRGGRLHYFDFLFAVPFGLSRPCLGSPEDPADGTFSCGSSSAPRATCEATCNYGFRPDPAPAYTCSDYGVWVPQGGQCVEITCPATTSPPGQPGSSQFNCATGGVGDVCTGACTGGLVGTITTECGENGEWKTVEGSCTNPCFSGDATVRVLGSDTPVTMRELRTGQHVQCLESGANLTSPATLRYCELLNWFHAENNTLEMKRVSFARSSGATGSITLSFTHLMMRLTSGSVNVGDSATNIEDFGAFETTRARNLAAGHKIVLLKDQSNPSTGFEVVSVTSVQTVMSTTGAFNPAFEMPYIVVNDVVVPVHVSSGIPLLVPDNVNGASAMIYQIFTSPLFMTQSQANNTAGQNGNWGSRNIWPGIWSTVFRAARMVRRGNIMDFAKLQEWFLPRYEEWKLDPTKAITANETATAIRDYPGLWVPREQVSAARGIVVEGDHDMI